MKSCRPNIYKIDPLVVKQLGVGPDDIKGRHGQADDQKWYASIVFGDGTAYQYGPFDTSHESQDVLGSAIAQMIKK